MKKLCVIILITVLTLHLTMAKQIKSLAFEQVMDSNPWALVAPKTPLQKVVSYYITEVPAL